MLKDMQGAAHCPGEVVIARRDRLQALVDRQAASEVPRARQLETPYAAAGSHGPVVILNIPTAISAGQSFGSCLLETAELLRSIAHSMEVEHRQQQEEEEEYRQEEEVQTIRDQQGILSHGLHEEDSDAAMEQGGMTRSRSRSSTSTSTRNFSTSTTTYWDKVFNGSQGDDRSSGSRSLAGAQQATAAAPAPVQRDVSSSSLDNPPALRQASSVQSVYDGDQNEAPDQTSITGHDINTTFSHAEEIQLKQQEVHLASLVAQMYAVQCASRRDGTGRPKSDGIGDRETTRQQQQPPPPPQHVNMSLGAQMRAASRRSRDSHGDNTGQEPAHYSSYLQTVLPQQPRTSSLLSQIRKTQKIRHG